MMSEDDQVDDPSTESYLKHFGLSDSPFQSDFAETLASCSPPIKESLEQIANKCWYTVEPILVASEPFCEKNPLCQVFLKMLGDDFAVCHVNVDVMTTSKTLLNDFSQKLSLEIDPDAFGPTLSQYFEANQDQGKEFAILVEGVHELSPEAFNLLMDLVQAEAAAESNLHFVFWGQNSLVAMVEAADTGDIKFSQIEIPEFTSQEIKAYVSACLADVGYSGEPLIDDEELEGICNEAAGSLVKINANVEAALQNKPNQVPEASDPQGMSDDIFAGLDDEIDSEEELEVEFEFEAENEEPAEPEADLSLALDEVAATEIEVEEEPVDELSAAEEIEPVEEAQENPVEEVPVAAEEEHKAESEPSPSFVSKFPLRHGVAALVLLLVLGLVYIGWGGSDDEPPSVASVETGSSGIVVRDVEESEPEELAEAAAPFVPVVPEQEVFVAEESVQEEVIIEPPSELELAVEDVVEVVSEEVEEPVIEVRPEVAEPVVVLAEPEVETVVPVISAPEPSVSRTRLAQQHAKLLTFPDDHYFLQLLGTFSEQSAQSFVDANNVNDQFYYFETLYRNRPWFVVVYGDFPSKAEASAAKTNLPESILKAEPWARSMADIRNSIKR